MEDLAQLRNEKKLGERLSTYELNKPQKPKNKKTKKWLRGKINYKEFL